MRFNIIYLMILCVSFITCNENNNLERINLEEGAKLYFYNLSSDKSVKNNEYVSNFYIDDLNTIRKFHKNLDFIENNNEEFLNFFQVRLILKDSIIYSALYDFTTDCFIQDNFYAKFNFDDYDWFKQKMKKTELYNVRMPNILKARKLYNRLMEENIYIPITNKYEKENPLFYYNYEANLTIKLDSNTNIFNVETKLQKKLQEKGFTIVNIPFFEDYNRLYIKIYSSEKNIEDVPNDFDIEGEFMMITNIEIPIIGIDKNKLIEIINELGIKDYDITETI